jgi:O-antigen/teichoic acid export membrane protein
MLYLTKGSFWLGISQFASSFVALLLSIAFANLIPKETYGVYKYLLSVLNILAIATLGGMTNALAQAIARGKEKTIFDGVRARLKYGTLGTIIAIGIGAYYYLNGNNTLAISFVMMGAFMPIMQAYDLYNSLLSGRKLFREYAVFNIITQFFYSVIIIGTLLISKDVIFILLAYLVSNTLINIILYIYVLKKYPPEGESEASSISYGKHLSLMTVISTIASELDKMLIFQFLGGTDLAIYLFAISPPEQLKGLFKNVNSLAFPKFATQTNEEIKKNIFSKALKLGIAVTIACVLYIIFAPLFFKILFPAYMQSVWFSQLYSISVIGASISTFLYTAFEAKGAKKELYKLNILINMTTLFLLYFLISYYGLIGAIISRILSRFLAIFIEIILIKKL